jgi:hypothetical protein
MLGFALSIEKEGMISRAFSLDIIHCFHKKCDFHSMSDDRNQLHDDLQESVSCSRVRITR